MKALLTKSLIAALVLTLCPVLLHAQATRTWVSGVGDDANPCSRTAPCKTFAGAIVKTVAGGEIDVLDPGAFGSVTITKSITIYGDGAEGSVDSNATTGITISTASTDVVVLRNIKFNGINGGGTTGINITGAGTAVIDNCEVAGFQTGISFTGTGAVVIKDTTVQNASTAAIVLAPSAASFVSIVRSHISDSTLGLSVAPHATVDVEDSISSGANGAGFLTTASGAVLTLTRCVAFDNVIGIKSSGMITLNDCAVMDNSTNGLTYTAGGQIATFGNNSVNGNNPDGAPSTFPILKK